MKQESVKNCINKHEYVINLINGPILQHAYTSMTINSRGQKNLFLNKNAPIILFAILGPSIFLETNKKTLIRVAFR